MPVACEAAVHCLCSSAPCVRLLHFVCGSYSCCTSLLPRRLAGSWASTRPRPCVPPWRTTGTTSRSSRATFTDTGKLLASLQVTSASHHGALVATCSNDAWFVPSEHEKYPLRQRRSMIRTLALAKNLGETAERNNDVRAQEAIPIPVATSPVRITACLPTSIRGVPAGYVSLVAMASACVVTAAGDARSRPPARQRPHVSPAFSHRAGTQPRNTCDANVLPDAVPAGRPHSASWPPRASP